MARTARERITGDPTSSTIYEVLVERISAWPGCEIQENASSFHVARGRAFLGIHPRRGGIPVNIVLTRQLDSPRVFRAGQVSANRWHHEIILLDAAALDPELFGWICEAYDLTG